MLIYANYFKTNMTHRAVFVRYMAGSRVNQVIFLKLDDITSLSQHAVMYNLYKVWNNDALHQL